LTLDDIFNTPYEDMKMRIFMGLLTKGIPEKAISIDVDDKEIKVTIKTKDSEWEASCKRVEGDEDKTPERVARLMSEMLVRTHFE
jgi:hypothetical protein